MKKCMEHTWTRGRMNDLFERCRWCGETRNLGSKAPSSPVETTEADECAHTALSLIYRRERDEALALVADLQTGLVNAHDTIVRLTNERTQALGEIDRLRAKP